MSVTLTGSLKALCFQFDFFFSCEGKKGIWNLEVFIVMINQWNQVVTFAHRKKKGGGHFAAVWCGHTLENMTSGRSVKWTCGGGAVLPSILKNKNKKRTRERN